MMGVRGPDRNQSEGKKVRCQCEQVWFRAAGAEGVQVKEF